MSTILEMTTRRANMSNTSRSVPSLVLGCLFLWSCGRSDGSNVSSSALQQACSSYADIYRQREANCYGVAAEPNISTLKARQTEACVLTFDLAVRSGAEAEILRFAA
jgi:hypothetical protein